MNTFTQQGFRAGASGLDPKSARNRAAIISNPLPEPARTDAFAHYLIGYSEGRKHIGFFQTLANAARDARTQALKHRFAARAFPPPEPDPWPSETLDPATEQEYQDAWLASNHDALHGMHAMANDPEYA